MEAPQPNEVTQMLARAGDGDPSVAEDLLPLIYDQLRGLARRQMANEPAGHTLQPTALVHEAYLRLIGDEPVSWNSRGHFYGAAAQAMRRILIERARKHGRVKHGGDRQRVGLNIAEQFNEASRTNLLAIDEALSRLQAEHERPSEVVMLRYFAGLSEEETASALGVSRRTVQGDWKFARVWLLKQLRDHDEAP